MSYKPKPITIVDSPSELVRSIEISLDVMSAYVDSLDEKLDRDELCKMNASIADLAWLRDSMKQHLGHSRISLAAAYG